MTCGTSADRDHQQHGEVQAERVGVGHRPSNPGDPIGVQLPDTGGCLARSDHDGQQRRGEQRQEDPPRGLPIAHREAEHDEHDQCGGQAQRFGRSRARERGERHGRDAGHEERGRAGDHPALLVPGPGAALQRDPQRCCSQEPDGDHRRQRAGTIGRSLGQVEPRANGDHEQRERGEVVQRQASDEHQDRYGDDGSSHPRLARTDRDGGAAPEGHARGADPGAPGLRPAGEVGGCERGSAAHRCEHQRDHPCTPVRSVAGPSR